MEETRLENRLKFGFFIALALLKKNREISLNQILSIPLLDEQESRLIYNELTLSPNVIVRKEKISSEPYLEFDRIITLKENFN